MSCPIPGAVHAFTALSPPVRASPWFSAVCWPRSCPRRQIDRVRVVYLTALFSLGAENLLLAFARAPWLWCAAQIVGWLPVPVMDANLDVILRTSIPVKLQGRVYACRNALQFFTIPVGLFLGGAAVDRIFEPLMAACPNTSLLHVLFGGGGGSGAAMLLGLLGVLSILLCLAAIRRLRKYHRPDQKSQS